jgi:hypothetical protein
LIACSRSLSAVTIVAFFPARLRKEAHFRFRLQHLQCCRCPAGENYRIHTRIADQLCSGAAAWAGEELQRRGARFPHARSTGRAPMRQARCGWLA